MKKILTLILALTLVMSLFAGCGTSEETTEEKAEETEETTGVEETEENIIETLGDFKDEVLFKVNDTEIMLSTGNILLYQIKSYYESMYGPTVWDMEAEPGITVEQFVKNDIQDVSIRTEVLYDKALKEGYEIDEDAKIVLIAQAATVFESYPAEIIAKYGFNLEQLQDSIVKQSYLELVFEEMTKDMVIDAAEVQAKMEENVVYQNMMTYGIDAFYDRVRARHILIKTVDDQNQPYSEEDKAASLAKIEDLLAQANDGADFAILASENTEDPGSVESGGEYTFGRGEMVPEFESAAYELEIGGISGVIETQYGYHIIKLEERIESSEEQIAQAELELKAIKEEAEYTIRLIAFDKMYEEIVADYTIETMENVWTAMTLKDF